MDINSEQRQENIKHGRNTPLISLYAVFALTFVYAMVQVTLSHISHSVTLRADSYHTVYNLLSLASCIGTIWLIQRTASPAGSLVNTFGWKRAEVLGIAISGVFLSALNFSVVIESLQTLLHASHGDELTDALHHEKLVLATGLSGVIVNIICFFVIGGYSYHQSRFLSVISEGNVIVKETPMEIAHNIKGQKTSQQTLEEGEQCHTFWDLQRDMTGCILVAVSAGVKMISANTSVYADPILALISVVLLTVTSIPLMKQSSFILLQTIPDYIDLEQFQKQLQSNFPRILSMHELHLWQLAPTKLIATAHLVFQDPKVYQELRGPLKEFFHDHGIAETTIQPEFQDDDITLTDGCYLRCRVDSCRELRCCRNNSDDSGIFEEDKPLMINEDTVEQLTVV